MADMSRKCVSVSVACLAGLKVACLDAWKHTVHTIQCSWAGLPFCRCTAVLVLAYFYLAATLCVYFMHNVVLLRCLPVCRQPCSQILICLGCTQVLS